MLYTKGKVNCTRVSDCCLTPNEHFFSYIVTRISYIRWNDNDILFVLDQHSQLDFYSDRVIETSLRLDMSVDSDASWFRYILISPRVLIVNPHTVPIMFMNSVLISWFSACNTISISYVTTEKYQYFVVKYCIQT